MTPLVPRRLALRLVAWGLCLTAAAPVHAQSVWTDPARPPCDAFIAFQDASTGERFDAAGDLREQSTYIATFDAVGFGPDAYLWADYMESGELFNISLVVTPPDSGRPTTASAWAADASELAMSLGRTLAACFASEPSEPDVWDQEDAESVTVVVTDGVQVSVTLRRRDEGALWLEPSVRVGEADFD